MGATRTILWVLMAAWLAGCGGTRFQPKQLGETCKDFDECASGLTCAHDGVCRVEGEPGTVPKGGDCLATSACRIGLVCSGEGECVEPGGPGTAAFDEDCDDTPDCQFGLRCVDGSCKGLELPFWAGGECAPEDEDADPFRVFFEVPGEETLTDFYRLPFPNDARVDGDDIDLSGHPSPGALIDLLGDVVGNVLRVVEADLDGHFGTNQAVFFRFSAFPDTTTLDFGIPGQGNLAIVDVTPGATSDALHPFRYELDSRPSPYICDNWLAMHPIDGRPFLPGHTYAAIVGASITDEDGEAAGSDDDFSAMLETTQPSDTRLQAAWLAYAPLRAWLTEYSVDGGDVAAAAVFTVQDPTVRAQLVRDAVHEAPLPTLDDAVLCGGGSDPFADADDPDRGCNPTSSDYDEIQGTVGLPQFQAGQPPFKDFADGGAIDTSARGPDVERTDDVHVTLTIPVGADMPESGWPLVIYGHGTGGNYTSVIRSGFADRFTEIDTGGETVHVAMLGFDAPLHGPRRHEENWDQAWLDVDPSAYDSDVLFFNPLNARAARDNALQQAADLWSLTRMVAALDLSAGASPTGDAIRFDMDHLLYVGHSQGGVVGPLYAAWEDEVDAVVLSGAGGLTIESLLHKTSPNDIPSAVRVGLADPNISRVHPILNLAQQVAESADGVNHARYVFRDPPQTAEPRHTLQTFGVGDTYSPDSTQYALARALGLEQVPNGNTPLENVADVSLPAQGNAANGATGVVILYEGTDRDPHFVLFDWDDAQDHVGAFLSSQVMDGVPTVE